jgi:hypothetical protein
LKENIKQLLILVILSVTFSITTNGQNLVFIGENSYQSTEKYTLKSNSNDLMLVFAKDGANALIVVSSKLKELINPRIVERYKKLLPIKKPIINNAPRCVTAHN